MVGAFLIAAAVTASAPDASAQAYAHVILAERYAAQGDTASAVRELRYALVFDYESVHLHARLLQLSHEPKKIASHKNRRRLPALDPRLQVDTQATTDRTKNVAERSSE